MGCHRNWPWKNDHFHGENELPNRLKCGILYFQTNPQIKPVRRAPYSIWATFWCFYSATFFFECSGFNPWARKRQNIGIAGLSQRASTPLCDVFYLIQKKSSPWIGTIGTCLSYWEVARFIWVSSMGKWRWHHPTRLEWESMRTWMTFF